MWPTVRDRGAWSVGRSVCLSVCHASEPCKTAGPIEMSFGLRTPVGPRNHVLDGAQIPLREGAILRGKIMPVDLPRGGKWARPSVALWWHYRPCGTSEFVVVTRGAMRPFVKLLWPLVYFFIERFMIFIFIRHINGSKLATVKSKSTQQVIAAERNMKSDR